MRLADSISYGSHIFKKSGPPVQLTYFITSRCNLRCSHCFYWKELDSDHTHELSVAEVEKIADSLPRILVLSLTGGEPFVRKDIDQIYGAFAQRARAHLITISSNGFYKDKMQALIPKMLEENPKTNMMIYISVDGPLEIHDKIRGKNSYMAAMRAIDMLQDFRKKYKNFGISASMTLNNFNQEYLEDTFKFLKSSKKLDQINIGLVRGDTKAPEAKTVDIKTYKKLTDLKLLAIKNGELSYPNLFMRDFVINKDLYTYKLVEHVFTHDTPILPCQSGALMGILYDNGNVHPCEILENSNIGNIRDYNYDFPKLWADHKAKEMRKKISNGCYCTFECAMSSSILFSPKYLTKIAVQIAAQKLSRPKPVKTPDLIAT